MVAKTSIAVNGLCLAIAISLVASSVAHRLASAANWDDDSWTSEDNDEATTFETDSRDWTDYGDEFGGGDRRGADFRNETDCQGETCNFRSTCGRAPLNRIATTRSSVKPFIVNGQDQVHGEWPSFAIVLGFLKKSRFHRCGGVLISDRHVLTAAHCIYEEGEKGFLMAAYLGSHKVYPAEDHSVVSLCYPSEFTKADGAHQGDNDWAVLTLGDTVKFNNYIQPACLPFEEAGQGKYQHCHFVGSGYTDLHADGKYMTSEVIQKMPVQQVPCTNSSSDAGTTGWCFTKSGSEGDACTGDSGGPILCIDPATKLWTVIGTLVSRKDSCDGSDPSGWTSSYTRLPKLLSTIKSTCKI